MKISIKKVNTKEEINQCLHIRFKVFVQGQSVPLEEDQDGRDFLESEHFLLRIHQEPVGTARIRYLADTAKIERVAILNSYQGTGLGKRLMETILDYLKREKKVAYAKLGAQTHAIPFYEKLGFIICSEEYLDAGISHKDMKISL
ncbi:GNAT family acetyltransferase (plasmid) [Legionella adelaidensis]|uniref:GNAT family acetyltransferase n=1 Tax=Legionella adelaidensis TaxID=45056 RepID=A0A0W0R151_9GAMM|nr:GNAT family N-acetyltransferase [Legionella adelaidensis]KTC64806.1 GNAT family acetyltransferase [Legionella adelaidensis]VEH86204.1 GNAT family acetyltransferase [Legionella adelaidensis]